MRHLVMVVPGIGGSVLRRGEEVVWDATVPNVLRRLASPAPLAVDRLDPTGPPVEADALAGPFGIAPFWAPFPGYDVLLTMLANAFQPAPSIDRRGVGQERKLTADIAAFPYDFRQSVATSSALLARDVAERQEARRRAGRPERVIVVAHSFGGLVARHWLASDARAAETCDLVVTLGTPHRGSPKALEVLADGLCLLGWRWQNASRVIERWPAMHELVPQYRAVNDESSGTGTPRRPSELALGLVPNLVRLADDAHATIVTGWTSGGRAEHVKLSTYYGTDQRTSQGATWDGKRLAFTADSLGWQPTGEDGGDGTVPARSAAPDPQDVGRQPVSCKHGWLVNEGEVARLVRDFTAGAAYLGDREPTRTFGASLDADELYLRAGQRFHAEVAIRARDGGPVASGDHSPSAQIRLAELGRPWECIALEPTSPGAWALSTKALPAGTYEVRVSAPHWLGQEHRPVQEVVTVVNQADLDAAAAIDESREEGDG